MLEGIQRQIRVLCLAFSVLCELWMFNGCTLESWLDNNELCFRHRHMPKSMGTVWCQGNWPGVIRMAALQAFWRSVAQKQSIRLIRGRWWCDSIHFDCQGRWQQLSYCPTFGALQHTTDNRAQMRPEKLWCDPYSNLPYLNGRESVHCYEVTFVKK